eukprot:TRINITY_DN18541_c0_g1_i1.p1 TRINITY_DN18541_c0_g1~~TRINITY_DN18541_c0_g1_i1.p1  ORF type:complete len:244 (-),score=64.93 TRINITY_DN18541_c0_g1_i1:129-860(-)
MGDDTAAVAATEGGSSSALEFHSFESMPGAAAFVPSAAAEEGPAKEAHTPVSTMASTLIAGASAVASAASSGSKGDEDFTGRLLSMVVSATAPSPAKPRSFSWSPWKEFANAKRFGLPATTADVKPRVVSNFHAFFLNYMTVIGCLLVFLMLTDFSLLFVTVLCAALWVYFFWWRANTPIVIAGKALSQSVVVACLLLVTVFLVWFVYGSTIFWLFGFAGVVILGHSVLYVSREEVVDFASPV